MQLWHDPLKISASFDDPNLVSRAGLVPVMSLAERALPGGPDPAARRDLREDRRGPGGEDRLPGRRDGRGR